MRYFVGYLIEGSAAEWHVKLSDGIAEKFNIWKISEKNPPHVTIYYTFESEDISGVRDFLKKWMNDNRFSENVILSGFDHFDDRVVFAKLEMGDSIEKKIGELRKNLEAVAPPKDTLLPDQLAWHPHATLAYKISAEKFNEIWSYVKTLEAPRFQMAFDNITIFKWENSKWAVEESLRF